METTFLTQILTDESHKIIAWTLIHSLWIGLIVALLAGAVLIFAQKSPSGLRYRLLCGCLFLFVAAMGLIIYLQVTAKNMALVEANVGSYPGVMRLTVTQSSIIHSNVSPEREISSFVNHHSSWIVTIWFLFFALRSLKLASGILYVHRIRRHRVHQVAREWVGTLNVLANKLRIRYSVILLQSELVKVPLTVGHFKPIILIPVGMIFQLPAAQVETILLHELAHIRRRDYLVNLVQSFVETLFFFNPALLWLSSLIRDERETCCDDIVLANTPGKSNYLEALLAFHNSQPVESQLVLGMGGNQLVNRLKRIINHENKRLNKMEKIVLLAGLLIISAFSFGPKTGEIHKEIVAGKTSRGVAGQSAVKNGVNIKHDAVHTEVKMPVRHVDTAVLSNFEHDMPGDTGWAFQRFLFVRTNEDTANRHMQVRDYKNNSYEIEFQDNKLTSLKINEVAVPENEFINHQSLLDSIDRAWRTARDNKQVSMANRHMYRERERAEREFRHKELDKVKFKSKNLDFARSEFKKSDNGLFEKRKIVTDRDRRHDLKHGKHKELKSDPEVRSLFKTEKQTNKLFKIEEQNGKEWKKGKEWKEGRELKEDREWKEGRELKEDKEWKVDRKYRKESGFFKPESFHESKKLVWAEGKVSKTKWEGQHEENDKWRSGAHWAPPVKKRMEQVDISADRERVRGVISELVKENVISKDTDVDWFGLSDDELIVNGNKQPEALQQRLKSKYDIKSGDGLYYGPVKMNGRGVFLDKGDL